MSNSVTFERLGIPPGSIEKRRGTVGRIFETAADQLAREGSLASSSEITSALHQCLFQAAVVVERESDLRLLHHVEQEMRRALPDQDPMKLVDIGVLGCLLDSPSIGIDQQAAAVIRSRVCEYATGLGVNEEVLTTLGMGPLTPPHSSR